MVCTSDFAGQVRGKGFPARELGERWEKGVGWTPTNVMINCFGNIPATPWGASGDLLMRPDPAGDVTIDFGDGAAPERFILGYVDELNGDPWACCPRHLLRQALDDLAREFGLYLRVAFEHEFTCIGVEPRPRRRVRPGSRAHDRRPAGDHPRGGGSGAARARHLPAGIFAGPVRDHRAAGPRAGSGRPRGQAAPDRARRRSAQGPGGRASRRSCARAASAMACTSISAWKTRRASRSPSIRPDPMACRRSPARSSPACWRTARRCAPSPRPAASPIERLRPNAWSASVTNLGNQRPRGAGADLPGLGEARRRSGSRLQFRVPRRRCRGDAASGPRRDRARRAFTACATRRRFPVRRPSSRSRR